MKLDRRKILKSAVNIGIPLLCSELCKPKSALAGITKQETKETIDRWMNELGIRSPTNALKVSRFADSIYFLLEPIGWTPDDPSQTTLKRVEVPKGFITDFASIPAIFWSILPPDGRYVYSAIIHDYLYWTQTTSREDADEILRIGMEEFDVNRSARFAIYHAVRSFGGKAWRSNADLKRTGEKRILKKFPSDPRINWVDWKKRSDVFM